MGGTHTSHGFCRMGIALSSRDCDIIQMKLYLHFAAITITILVLIGMYQAWIREEWFVFTVLGIFLAIFYGALGTEQK